MLTKKDEEKATIYLMLQGFRGIHLVWHSVIQKFMNEKFICIVHVKALIDQAQDRRPISLEGCNGPGPNQTKNKRRCILIYTWWNAYHNVVASNHFSHQLFDLQFWFRLYSNLTPKNHYSQKTCINVEAI